MRVPGTMLDRIEIVALGGSNWVGVILACRVRTQLLGGTEIGTLSVITRRVIIRRPWIAMTALVLVTV